MNVGLRVLLAPAAVAALVAGCSSAAQEPATPTPTAVSEASAKLAHQPTGEARIVPDGSKMTVDLQLSGMAPSSTHPVQLVEGSCQKPGTKAAVDLTAIAADATGVGKSSTTTAIPGGKIPATGWYMAVLQGPGTKDKEATVIACGDVNAATTPAIVEFREGAAEPGGSQSASGNATLKIENGSLMVTVTAAGLSPGSVHAAHIHVGACTNQGAVVYPLTNVTADSTGNSTSTTTIPNVSTIPTGQWYVNVHNTTTLTTQDGFDPIICGPVIPLDAKGTPAAS